MPPSAMRQAWPLSTRLLAPLHRPVGLGDKAGADDWRSIGRGHLAVEPSRAVGVDLRFEVDVGKRAERHPSPSLGVVIPGAGLEVAGNTPMVGVDPLDDARPAQRLQPPDMALDIGAVVATRNADAARIGQGAVSARAIVARLAREARDVSVRRARPRRRGDFDN